MFFGEFSRTQPWFQYKHRLVNRGPKLLVVLCLEKEQSHTAQISRHYIYGIGRSSVVERDYRNYTLLCEGVDAHEWEESHLAMMIDGCIELPRHCCRQHRVIVEPYNGDVGKRGGSSEHRQGQDGCRKKNSKLSMDADDCFGPHSWAHKLATVCWRVRACATQNTVISGSGSINNTVRLANGFLSKVKQNRWTSLLLGGMTP